MDRTPVPPFETRARGGASRRALPPSVPQLDLLGDLDAARCPCCGQLLARLGLSCDSCSWPDIA